MQNQDARDQDGGWRRRLVTKNVTKNNKCTEIATKLMQNLNACDQNGGWRRRLVTGNESKN